MDILASRLAKDANAKSKSTKKAKKLNKDDLNKGKTRSIPKVDSSKVEKITKKQKVKKVIADIPSNKKQLIKNIISENNENEKLIQKVTKIKSKKSKSEGAKQKLVDITKSLKDVISKSQKGKNKNAKKNAEVLKNKINLQSNEKPTLNIASSKTVSQAEKNVQAEILKNNKIKKAETKVVKNKKVQIEPEVVKSKKAKIESEVVKSKKAEFVPQSAKNKKAKIELESVKSKKVTKIEPEVVKGKKTTKIETATVKSTKVTKIEPQSIKSKKGKKIELETEKNNKTELTEPKVSKNNLESGKKIKLSKKEIKKSKALKENIINNVEPTKTKNVVKGEKTDNLNKKTKLKSKNAKLVKVENNEEIKSIKSKKRKLKDVEEEVDSQSSAHPTLTKKEILPFVKALLKVDENQAKNKNSLFNSEKPPILLSITSIKVPKVALHQMRITLPHCMVTDNDDVALFVKDLKKGRRRDYENTVHHYEDLLQKHGCNRVKTIIPINQVKTEYRQFEMRRRLLNSHDYFLVDGRISGHMAHLLGKAFRQKRKLPTPIHMDKKDLKEVIDDALKKTSLEIHSNGDSSITQVATCSMSADKIAENILAVVKHLDEHFPGGWSNIRSLNIKTPLGTAIPIYLTLKNRNTVEVPVVNPKRPKAYQDVEGELSTFTKNVSVKVAPDGTVDVQRLGGDESDNEDDEDDEEDEEEANEQVSKDTESKIKKEKTKENEDDEDEGDDDDNDGENEEVESDDE